MSHFSVVVLVPQDNVPEPGHPGFIDDLTIAVEDMLAPFDENIEADPYPQPCSCGKYAVLRKVRELTESETGLTVDGLRSVWWAKSESEREETTWEDHLMPYMSVYKQHEETLMADVKPEEDCDECHGTGTYQSTYNPLSKWDWYSVGGRWDGHFEESGVTTIIRNVAFARELHSAAYSPFAILSPREPFQKQHHDNWNQSGDMGWWGMVSNENDNWEAIASEILNKYSACFAVLVDCHI